MRSIAPSSSICWKEDDLGAIASDNESDSDVENERLSGDRRVTFKTLFSTFFSLVEVTDESIYSVELSIR
jgi:hypothetical protein